MALVDRRLFDRLEAALRADPAGLYDRCDLVTRERYRAVVDEVARWCDRDGREVADRAVELARSAAECAGRAAPAAHVGHYLLGPGRPELEASIGARPPARVRTARWLGARAVPLHLLALTCASLAMTAALLAGQASGAAGLVLAILAAPAACAAFWSLALLAAETVHAVGRPSPPLPHLDFSGGVPDEYRTLVVVPCLLRSTGEVDHLARVLQEHAARAPGLGLRFCLLGDFADAPREVMPGDAEILAHARQAIAALNRSSATPSGCEFLLLHRPRRWNPRERVWMGHERKRGKLCDLNQVILGAEPTAFFPGPDARLVRDVAFVITLDVDNRLAEGAVLRLIETLAHPLNRAEGKDGEPTGHGYGLLQPRIAANPVDPRASRYERWAAGDLGTEEPPEKRNHLQQDRFGEASYFGKGIYEVAAFERSTRGRFPDNAILSHDLPEGCFARAATVADACVLESSPPDYRSEASRRHRWIRGDWQNLLWMFARPRPGAAGARGLSLLSRWKIAENVRRNALPAALLWLLALGFFVAPHPVGWTAAVLSVLIVPRATSAAWDARKLLRQLRSRRIGLRDFAAGAARLVHQAALRTLVAAAIVPFEAGLFADAAVRSSWRTLRGGRGLLAWTPFDGGATRAGPTGASHVALLRAQLLAAAALAILLAALRPHALVVAAPLLLLWLSAPALVWWVGLPGPIASRPVHMPALARRSGHRSRHRFGFPGRVRRAGR